MRESKDNANQLDSRKITFMYGIPLTFILHALHIGTLFFYPRVRSGYMVQQLVEAMHHKPEGHGFDSSWSHWDYSLL